MRYIGVTGVQTCALPIYRVHRQQHQLEEDEEQHHVVGEEDPEDAHLDHQQQGDEQPPVARLGDRSEERRVGKECRSRWSLYHLNTYLHDNAEYTDQNTAY